MYCMNDGNITQHACSYCTCYRGNPYFGIQLIVVACQCGTGTEGLKYTMLHNQKTTFIAP